MFNYCSVFRRKKLFLIGLILHSFITEIFSKEDNSTQLTDVKPKLEQRAADGCELSVTEVKGKRVCKGALIFSDKFDDKKSFRKWTHDIIMPWVPDYPFVVFKNDPENWYINNSRLHIVPTVLDDDEVKSGRVELLSCTGRGYTEECERQAGSFSILPPVKSARVTTKNTFSFKYGRIDVRAKMPIGDWLVPEIWLEPKNQAYGPYYTSGRIRIAMARGNKNLKHDGQHIGMRKLESGIVMGIRDKIRARTVVRELDEGWYKTFHTYSLIWGPDNLDFEVDGKGRQNLLSPGDTLAELAGFDGEDGSVWKKGSAIAPFDEEFYLSFGLSVGGIRDFPDDSMSGDNPKPWKNTEVKAMLRFWQAKDKWYPTWHKERSKFQIIHVKVHAL